MWMPESNLLIDLGMMVPEQVSLKQNRKILTLDYRKDPTPFYYGVEGMLCFSHRKNMKSEGSLNTWYGMCNRGIQALMTL